MHEALMLLAAFVACIAGMGWFALSMETHWQQARGTTPRPAALAGRLRWLGAVALAAALVLCLLADSASIAVLVWLMSLAAAALAVAFTLTWRASLLTALVFWTGR